MYLEHFGLSAPPFQFTASPAVLFMSRTHRETLAALEWGLLHEPSGLMLLVGESGTGKTTLVCALLARQYRDVRAAYLGNPKLTFLELMGSILSQLGVRGGRGTKGAMLNAFSQFTLGLPPNQRIAIMIDEAQALSDDALEEFRLLSNLERDGRKAAQIILAGQFELMRRLADPAMHHLNERIGSRAVLQPLTALECRQYIEHRLRLCHGSSDRIFDRRALDLIVQESAGIPRRINALCHNSLLLAYSARARMVTLAMAREAAADYGHLDKRLKPGNILASLPARFNQGIRSLSPVVGVGLLGIAGFVAGQIVMGPTLHPHIGLWGGHPASSSETAPSMRVVSIDPKLPAETPSARAEGEAGPGSAEIESPGLKSSGGEMPNPGSETTVLKSGASGAASSSSNDSNTATSEPKPKRHRKDHHRKSHAQDEFTEQQLQEMQAHSSSK